MSAPWRVWLKKPKMSMIKNMPVVADSEPVTSRCCCQHGCLFAGSVLRLWKLTGLHSIGGSVVSLCFVVLDHNDWWNGAASFGSHCGICVEDVFGMAVG